MSTIWIKICGITRQQDASLAAELGANAIGLVFYPASPRAVTVAQASVVLQGRPTGLAVCALFVNPSAAEVQAVVATGLFNLLQFHGEETACFCESFGLPYVKAFRVRPGQDLKPMIDEFRSADLILLDSYDEKAPGGTGKPFDWAQARAVAESKGIRLVLAGGLNPDNVGAAIAQLNPYGVDVSSGVEHSPGIKDPRKMKSLIEGARSVKH